MQRWARAFRDSTYHAAVETNNGTEALNRALKYAYLPRKTSLTLTRIACLIVDQFLPDMYQNYVFQNFKQLNIYRLPSAAIPLYLQGRPPSVVKHCLVRKTRSNKFTRDAVEDTDKPGVFHIIKDAGRHTVNFGCADGMPACSCKDWTKWHIPCKHFFAVFRWRPNWSWNALPQQYRDSAYLSTDNAAIGEYLTAQGVRDLDNPFTSERSSSVLSCESPMSCDNDDMDTGGEENSQYQHPIPSKQVRLHTTQSQCHYHLYTYTCTSSVHIDTREHCRAGNAQSKGAAEES